MTGEKEEIVGKVDGDLDPRGLVASAGFDDDVGQHQHGLAARGISRIRQVPGPTYRLEGRCGQARLHERQANEDGPAHGVRPTWLREWAGRLGYKGEGEE
ncbi:hypothetical protein E2562_030655 [Oryza meyeriana var. granulata]|uniref:Uncharacterized protein n=1 Tax=Oryza meyeriana var. granulata TaxID=110450 RepID=A0A6G1D9R1_9ORYZ|nr:hypothetical protein E2562_030655 [Oryza meyeriana var. granulata]